MDVTSLYWGGCPWYACPIGVGETTNSLPLGSLYKDTRINPQTLNPIDPILITVGPLHFGLYPKMVLTTKASFCDFAPVQKGASGSRQPSTGEAVHETF